MKIYNNKNYQYIFKIKEFFLKKNTLIVIIILSCIVVFISTCYWSNDKIDSKLNLPMRYENIINMIDNDQLADYAKAEEFIKENKNIYGALASLKLAQKYVNKNELEKAINQLQLGSIMTNDDNIKTIINIRIARIKLQQKKIHEALKTLDSIKRKNFSSIVDSIRGEAFLVKGDKKSAYNIWEKIMKDKIPFLLGEIIQMKMNDLSL